LSVPANTTPWFVRGSDTQRWTAATPAAFSAIVNAPVDAARIDPSATPPRSLAPSAPRAAHDADDDARFHVAVPSSHARSTSNSWYD